MFGTVQPTPQQPMRVDRAEPSIETKEVPLMHFFVLSSSMLELGLGRPPEHRRSFTGDLASFSEGRAQEGGRSLVTQIISSRYEG